MNDNGGMDTFDTIEVRRPDLAKERSPDETKCNPGFSNCH